MNQNRRDLLKGTIIGSGALIAGAAHAKPEPKGKPKPETYDVVVVGAGFAGMCAALEAAENKRAGGLSVLAGVAAAAGSLGALIMKLIGPM